MAKQKNSAPSARANLSTNLNTRLSTKAAQETSPVIPDVLLTELLVAIPPIKMAKKREANLKKNLLAKIAASAVQDAEINAAAERAGTIDNHSGITTTRAGAGRWFPKEPGIDVQVLFDDGRTMTWLARFAAGARLAPHKHHGTEESSVLKGSCYVGKMLLNQGDYQLAIDGSEHGEVYSPEGCVLLIRSGSLKTMSAKSAKVRPRASL